jgi:hypothetical protein
MESLAQEVFGSRHVLTTEALSGGLRHHGLFIHRIGNTRIVEKITSKAREITIAEHLAQKGSSILPRVHEVRRRGEQAHIFMEFIPRIGRIPAPSRRIFRALSKGMLAIHREFHSLGLPIIDHSSDRLLHRLKALPAQIDLGLAEETIPSFVERFDRLPFIVCHNDLNWPNMSVSEGWFRAECRFIDFALVARNGIGADLFQFATRAAGGTDKEMFDGLVASFAKNAAADERDVQFAARFYALIRNVAHMTRVAREGQLEKVDRTKVIIAALLAQLQGGIRQPRVP